MPSNEELFMGEDPEAVAAEDLAVKELAEAEAKAAQGSENEEDTETAEAETETTETPTEEPTDEDEPAPEPVLTDAERVFKEYGFDRQFPGGISAALQALKESQRYIGQLEQRRKELEEMQFRQPQPKPEKPRVEISAEQLWENPAEALPQALRQMGFVTQEEANEAARIASLNAIHQYSMQNFIESTPDYSEYEPKMMDLLHQVQRGGAGAMKALYTLVKAGGVGQQQAHAPAPKPPTTPADPDKKQRASTTGGKSTTAKRPTGAAHPSGLTEKDFQTMPLEKLQEKLGYGDE